MSKPDFCYSHSLTDEKTPFPTILQMALLHMTFIPLNNDNNTHTYDTYFWHSHMTLIHTIHYVDTHSWHWFLIFILSPSRPCPSLHLWLQHSIMKQSTGAIIIRISCCTSWTWMFIEITTRYLLLEQWQCTLSRSHRTRFPISLTEDDSTVKVTHNNQCCHSATRLRK